MGAERLAPAALTYCGSWKVGHGASGHLPVELSASVAWKLLAGLELVLGQRRGEADRNDYGFH